MGTSRGAVHCANTLSPVHHVVVFHQVEIETNHSFVYESKRYTCVRSLVNLAIFPSINTSLDDPQ